MMDEDDEICKHLLIQNDKESIILLFIIKEEVAIIYEKPDVVNKIFEI